MIGKKVECSKCKYRFTVEDPSSEGDGTKPKKKKGDAKKGAKKAKSGSGILIGGLLGVLAIGLLAVGAYFLFFNDKDKGSSTTKGGGTTTSPSNSSGTGSSSASTPDGTSPPGGEAVVGVGQPHKGGAGANDKDVTNLLPGETNAVYRVNMDRIAQTPLYGAFFDRNTLDFFKNSLTFEVGDIETYIHCVVGPDRYHYDIFRLKKPLEEITLLQRLDQVKGAQSPIREHYYGTLKSNAFVHALGRALSTEALFGETGLPVTPEDKKRWGENKPSAFCLFDAYTLIIAEESTLERFLNDLTPNGYPPYRTELTSPDTPPDTGTVPAGPGEGPGGPGGPAGEGGPPAGPGGGPGKAGIGLLDSKRGGEITNGGGIVLMGQGRRPQQPPPGGGPSGGAAPAQPGGGAGAGPGFGRSGGFEGPGGTGQTPASPPRRNYTSIPTYRTIDESIKAMLNRLEEDERNPPAAVYAEKLDRRLLDQRSLQAESIATQGTVIGAVAGLLQNANVIGVFDKRVRSRQI